MSDAIKHECGLAFIRLRKPFSYYLEKYGTTLYGINKLYLLMEKQHNRGQDGAGIAVMKLGVTQGYAFLSRWRSNAPQPIADIFTKVAQEIKELEKLQPTIKQHPEIMKGHSQYLGELLLGHLRYGTQGKNNVAFCHPFIKQTVTPETTIALAGNFNLVNVDELYKTLHIDPTTFEKQSDLAAMLETIHSCLCKAVDKTNLATILQQACTLFDGGYAISGLIGNGYSFVMRDAHGIRPVYYYADDEVIVAASERACIRTAFNTPDGAVQELMPGTALLINDKGAYKIETILPPQKRSACSFERIYFSRGGDEKIYRERIALGEHLSKRVLESINHDLKNTIFSYIPNTAEVAFYGLVKGMEDYLNHIKVQRIMSWNKDFNEEQLHAMINRKIRQEKIAIKDVKLRTFITDDSNRDEMVQHVYDITYGTVRKGLDTLVVIDDSIVRGTTLQNSIIRMLGRLEPKKIIIVSSAPQIRYPDCYGIDMSKMIDFIAFRASIALLKETHQEAILQTVYKEIKLLQANNKLHEVNLVRNIYKPFSLDEISKKIAQLITPSSVAFPVEVIYQSIEDLHASCPTNSGDWYFTGNYPTPGGNRVCNTAFLNYIEGKNARGYE